LVGLDYAHFLVGLRWIWIAVPGWIWITHTVAYVGPHPGFTQLPRLYIRLYHTRCPRCVAFAGYVGYVTVVPGQVG